MVYDFVAVGGGAAGYFGAIAFAESAPGSRAVILEKSGRVLDKVRISGGGRCNVTHACYEPMPLTAHYPRGEKSLIGPFHRWSAGDTVDWFEAHGVTLKTEEDGRLFPVTDDSVTVIECLERAADELGIEVRRRCEVESLRPGDDRWTVTPKEGPSLESRSVLLATGGTRNRAGERLAGAVGHTLVPPSPSLFTFRIDDPRLEGLAGLSVDDVEAWVPGTSLRARGPCLVTHWGLSGPAILKLSAWGARELGERDYRFDVAVRWCGESSAEEIEERLVAARESAPKRRVRSGIETVRLPARLWRRLVERAGIAEDTTWSNLPRQQRRALGALLAESTFAVRGKSLNKEEFVTAGGVSLDEVDFRTMESRVAPGLHFAGEVLDVDGITGGFNFQAAWTTSRIAGEAAARRS